MSTPAWTRTRGEALVAHHLGRGWSFGFDRARARAGCCHHDKRLITCSAHLIAHMTDEETEQVILHEIAHAIAGAAAGHGPVWRAVADRLGYTGRRTVDLPTADETARWLARCPSGHEWLRHRRTSRRAWCGTCAKAGLRSEITWWDRRPAPRSSRSSRSSRS